MIFLYRKPVYAILGTIAVVLIGLYIHVLSLRVDLRPILFGITQIVEASEYQPEDYWELPAEARSFVDEQRYAGCLQELQKSRYSFFKVRYLSDGLKVVGYIAVPKTFSSNKKYPLVLSNRGGNREFGRFMACSLRNGVSLLGNGDNNILLFPQLRGVAGGEGKEEFGGADVNDATTLLDIGRKIPQADTSRVFVEGWSRGGMTTYLMLKKQVKVNAAIIVAGEVDLISEKSERPEMETVFRQLIASYSKNGNATLKERSALYWADQINAPVLIVHGDKDDRVAVRSAKQIDAKLSELKKNHKTVIYPGEGHGLSNVYDQLPRLFNDWMATHGPK